MKAATVAALSACSGSLEKRNWIIQWKYSGCHSADRLIQSVNKTSLGE